MFKVAPLAALLAGALFLSNPAFAISSESSSESGAGTTIADPDDQIDEITSPSGGTDGSATIEMPPIDAPGDSDDYTPPPDSEDDSGDVTADPAPGTSN
jgi:hypothetical protein